jgi:cobalt-precorrin-5B (C1)-methyltransferase
LEKISFDKPIKTNQINIIAGYGVGIKQKTSEICISEFAKEVLYENLLNIIPKGFNLNLEIIFPNGEFLAERTSNKSFGIVRGLSIIGTSAETYSSAAPDQLEQAKNNLAKLIKNDFKGKVVFVIGENGFNLVKNCNVKLPIIKVGNWIGPLMVDAAIKKVKTVILFGYHGKLIKLAGGIFHTHNHLADGRMEILVYLAVKEKLPLEIITKLSLLNTLEEALLLLERFNKSIANKLFQNLSNTIEERSFEYVNRYIKTDMRIAAIIFDRKRKIRWSGSNGKDYISYFQ